MEAPGNWSQLSISSKKALQWAAIMAALRAEQRNEVSPQAVDVFDLFIGMLLAHPRDSEAKILLEHFGLVPGQVLPDDYPLPLEKDLKRLMASIPDDEPPLMDNMVSAVVASATSFGLSSGSPQYVELQALYVALLHEPTPFMTALDDLLVTRGVSTSELQGINQDYLSGSDPDSDSESRKSYEEILKESFPYNPEPVKIPSYMADHGQEMNLSHDLVDIRAEVDAFAYLLASRTLKPPLAIGLFGDWGSGKSFFMDSVRTRIDQLVTHNEFKDKEQSEVPFWQKIIQIEFNAWHYVEGDLWASLVDHIFNQLSLAGDKKDLLDQRKEFWINKLENKLTKLANLEKQKQEAEQLLQTKKRDLDNVHQERRQSLLEVERLKQESVKDILLKSSVNEVKKALEPLMLSLGLPSSDEVIKQLRQARTELKRGRALFQYLESEKWSLEKAGIFLVFLLIPLVVAVLSYFDFSSVVTAFAGISSTLVVALGVLARVTHWANGRFNAINEAEKKVNQEINQKRSQWQVKIKAEEKRVEQANTKLDQLLEEEKDVSESIKKCEEELKDITPARVLNEFVAERAGSGDYRSRLGVPALIQQDFKELTSLISRYNNACETGKKDKDIQEKDKQHYFNRIVLYIDDLDRCPDERVVEVLQAVHLLLAFELFVVVVAVDSRWLNHALMKHYPALSQYKYDGSITGTTGMNDTNKATNGDVNGKNKATSEDYLEKIFQIPFWVRPLGDNARKNMVRRLMRGSLEHTVGQQEENKQTLKLEIGDEEKQILSKLDARMSPPALDATTLTISHDEMDFLDKLSPLMGDTPRTVKRFVNLYQLVRIVFKATPRNTSVSDSKIDNQKLAFILAIGDGLPHLAPDYMDMLMQQENQDSLQIVFNKLSSEKYVDEHETLSKWLLANVIFSNTFARDFHDVISTVERFLFRTGVDFHG